jgi:PPM family protein phosphatase
MSPERLAAVGLAIVVLGALIALLSRRRARRRRELAPPPVRVVVGSHVEPGSSLPVIDFDEDEEDFEELTRHSDFSEGVESCPAVPIAFDESALDEETTSIEPHFLVFAVGRTDRGKKRPHNEDTVLVNSDGGLCVVADGMGGHKGGEVASGLAVETIAKALDDRIFEGKSHPTLPARGSEVVRAIQAASSRIRDVARERPELSHMGTTVVAARFSPDKRRVYIGHVGDSRCYRYRDGALVCMTRDHTMACFGVVGEGAALLSRAVGPRARVLTDLVVGTPRIGDIYLLCSDGLTKMVPDDLIRDVLATVRDVGRAADWLVELANGRGGADNISVVLVRVVGSERAVA